LYDQLLSPFDTAHMTSYYRSIATIGLSRTVSEINGNFSRKSQIVAIPVYFAPPLTGFPWELSIGARVKKLESWGYRTDKV